LPSSKINNSYRAIIIQNRMEDTRFLHNAISRKFPNFNLVYFESILDAFHEIVHSKCDLLIIDSGVQGFESFAAIKLVKAFNDNVPIIVTCTEKNKFTGLKSVVEGADNYYIIRYNYVNMLERIISLTLNLVSTVDFLRNHEVDKSRELIDSLDLKSKLNSETSLDIMHDVSVFKN
jgi:DNA-binding NarL/FixJ family response regulator